MGFIVVIILMVLMARLGLAFGQHATTGFLLLVTVGLVAFGLTLPRETLAAVITFCYWILVAPMVLFAWIGRAEDSPSAEKFVTSASKLFFRKK